MSAVLARIALRYIAGSMVTAGYLDPALGSQIGADPDLLMIVGSGLAALVEVGYAFAKKRGWAT